MTNQPLEDDGMPAEIDFSKGVRGLHHVPSEARVLMPASIERSVWEYFSGKAEQKGVDLRISLDIARLSLRSLVDAVVVVTGDSDLIPAFKFARREGIRVYLDHMGHGVKRADEMPGDRRARA